MLLVIDSNVYIFGFGFVKVLSCRKLIFTIIEKHKLHTLRISRRIVEEVRSHLSPEDFVKFIKVINTLTIIDEDIVVPFEIVVKYETEGLKPAIAEIEVYIVNTSPRMLTSNNDIPNSSRPEIFS